MKKKILSGVVALSVLSVASLSAQAGEINHAGQFYIAPSLGAFLPHSDANGRENTPSANLAVGYNVTQKFATQLAVSGNDSPTIRAEGIWNLEWKPHWTPYLAAGVGYFHLGASGVGVDVGGGLKYDIDQNFGLSGNYRYLLQASSGIPNGSLIDFGVTYSFGGAQDVSSMSSGAKPVSDVAKKDAEMYKRYVLPKGISECTDLTSDMTRESVGCYTVSGNTVEMHLDVKFAFDSSNLTDSGVDAMKRLASFMKQYPETDVTLKGYASDEGMSWQEKYNKKLSHKRAEAAKVYLMNSGVNPSRIEVLGEGYSDPVASNKTAEGRAENRRVETVITDVPLREEMVKK